MNKFFKNKYVCLSLAMLAAICGGIAFYYIAFNSSNLFSGFSRIARIMMPVIDGFVVAYLLSPAVNYIESKLVIPVSLRLFEDVHTVKKKKMMRSVSILITMLLFFLSIYVFLLMVIPQIVQSIKTLSYNFPSYERNLETWLSNILKDNPDIEAMVEDYMNNYMGDVQKFLTGDVLPWANTIIKTLSTKVLNAFVVILNLIIGLIISVYMLFSKEHFSAQGKKLLYAFFNEKTANKILDELRFVHKTFGGFIIGKIVDSVIIGLLCFVGCTMFEMPYSILISFIVGITNVIPFFGPYIGAVPSALLILMVDPLKCLYFIIFILVLQQVDGNIIGPKILGESTGLSGFWVIFAITIFGGLFGILGMFIGVPVFAVCYSLIKRWCRRRLKAKGLPESTTAYTQVRHVHNGVLQIVDDPSVPVEKSEEPVKITVQVHKDDSDDATDTPDGEKTSENDPGSDIVNDSDLDIDNDDKQ